MTSLLVESPVADGVYPAHIEREVILSPSIVSLLLVVVLPSVDVPAKITPVAGRIGDEGSVS